MDRGFRDSISVMQTLGLDVAMPPLLDGKRQFLAEEANQSRCIIKVRWVVEAANRRIKEFKYFANAIQNSSLCYLENDLSVVCALINRYQRSIAISKADDTEIGQKLVRLLSQQNKIQLINNINVSLLLTSFHVFIQLLEQNNLIRRHSQWETIDHVEIFDSFPIMSEEDIGDLTFGNKSSYEFYAQIYFLL